MSFQNRRPSSRRDRRRQKNSRRETAQGLDKTFLLIVVAFVLLVLLFLAVFAYFRA